ncbi:acyltransferase family domain-containing protein [Phthorimaea operculella]|nr:acyltransferase family domain-containing protein [Phthorimaea operculella]
MLRKSLILVLVFKTCAAVIYHLNDSEYERMPPVYGLEKYDHCMRDEGGTYCTATVQLFSEDGNELMTLIEEYSAHRNKHYNHSIIERGVCITRSCRKFIKNREKDKQEYLEQSLAGCINETMWKEYGLQTKLLEYQCTRRNEDQSKDKFDYFVICLIFSLLLLNVSGTICDNIIQRQNLEKNGHHGYKHYLLCFSIAQNWNWLVSSEPDNERLRKLKGLHGVKCVVMFLFIVGHVFYMFHAYTDNPHKFEKYYDYTWYKLLFNGMVSVQILFCISGFLLVYHLYLESEKRDITWDVVPKVIILRFCRLFPANALYVLFSATLLRNWGSGPIWNRIVTTRMSGDCRRYWWSHLMFINNYIPDDRFCVVQNWQLAADFQLFILGLCVFVATKPHRRAMVLSLMLFVGMLAMAAHIWWNNLDALMILNPEIYRSFDSPNYAIRKFAHVNVPGFVIGMLTGHFIYKLQKEKADFTKYKPVLDLLCSFVIPSICVIFFTGSFFYEDGEQASLLVRILYGTALAPVMALITSYMIFGIVFRLSDFWVNFLEWNGWVIPGRLTYSISLVHTFFIISLFGSRTQLMHVSSLHHAVLYLGIGVLSFIFSVPYCLMVEAPFNKLVKTIMTRNAEQVKKIK